MVKPLYDDNQQPTFDYFVPGQLVLLVEHDSKLGRDELAYEVRRELLRADDRLGKAEIDPGRVVSFERGQYQERLFSFVFVDIQENDSLLRVIESIDHYVQVGQSTRIRLHAVSPNWLASPANPRHIGTGGPGAKPVPFASSPTQRSAAPFEFEILSLPQMQQKQTQARYEVDVAILDTAPTLCDLERAYGYWHEEHPLLHELLGPNGSFELPNTTFRITYAPPDLMNPLNHPANYYGVDGHDYMMTDHGLFAAGIIHSIAPQARLHLIQVLNDYGIGTLETIAAGLSSLIQPEQVRPLVVNLSLTLNLPLDTKHQHSRFKLDWEYLHKNKAFVKRMGSMLEGICDDLRAREVIVVAAAGNDWRRGRRPRARVPASFDSVVGVGALGRLEPQQRPAAAGYSNLADAPKRAGIMTFGGNSTPQRDADPEKGLLGIYIGRFPNGEPSRNGWARWAGTSFATPIVSGVLAQLGGQGTRLEDAVSLIYKAEVEPGPADEQLLLVRQG